MTIHVTLFPDVLARSKTERDFDSLDDLYRHIEAPREYPSKSAMPLLKLALFGNVPTTTGALRHDANVLEVFGIELDYDGEVVDLDDAAAQLHDAGVAAILYSSPSHTTERPRWRALLPFARPHPPEERARFVARANGVLGGIVARESFTLSQTYYAGRVAGVLYLTAKVQGAPIDTLDGLDAQAIGAPERPRASALARVIAPERGGSDPMPSGVAEGERNDHMYRFLCLRRAEGADDATIANIAADFNAGCSPPLPQHEVDTIVRSVCRHAAGVINGRPFEERPRAPAGAAAAPAAVDTGGDVAVPAGESPAGQERASGKLQVTGGARSTLAQECARSLARDQRVYVRGGALVRVVTAAEAERGGLLLRQARGRHRAPDALVIVPALQAWLQTTLTANPGFYRMDAQGEMFETDCPVGIAAAVHTLGVWPRVEPLLGLAGAPFLRADGTVCSADGYDSASKMLLRNVGTPVAIPDQPTKDDAARALETLLAPFKQFPFKNDAHKASFVALILTGITRHLYETAPGFMVTAAAPGTGKTLLAECAGLITTGTAVGTRSFPVKAEEMLKTFTGIASAGDPFVIFDNITNGSRVTSAPLNQFLTTGIHLDRVLGSTNSTRMPNVATTVMTGNNISPRGDLQRRLLQVRVVADVENPERRTFNIADLKQHVRQYRPALVADALTILRAFVVAGAPRHSGEPLGGFKHWDDLVRSALIWAGADDPLQTQTDAMNDDDENAGAVALLIALKAWGEATFTTAKVIAALPTTDGQAIREAMHLAGVDEDHLGYWLRANRDRPHGALRLEKEPGAKSAAKWRIR